MTLSQFRHRLLLGSAVALATSSLAAAQTLTLTPAQVPSDTGARAIATADFDRNGWPDVAHANFGRNTVTVLLNAGASGLARSSEMAVGQGPFDMTAADFNRDGLIDLAVANADANSLSVLLSRGDGTFRRVDTAVQGNPRGIAAADVNRDGKMDLLYTGYELNRLQVLIGGGGGTFSTGASATVARPQGVAAADFNHDGRPDVAVASATTGAGLTVFYTNSNGTMTARAIAGDQNLNVLTAADLNRDGWLDVAAASTGGNRVAVYLGGASGVTHKATYATGASPRGIVAADLNHDGAVDLATANRDAHTVSVLTGRPQSRGTFEPPDHFSAGRGSRAVVAADFNHDGRLDLASGNQDAAAVTLLWNDTAFASAGFAFVDEQLPGGDFGSGNPATVADFNHNGIPDLLLGNLVLLDGTTRRQIATSVYGCTAGDFNVDGRTDVVCRSYNSNTLPIFHGDGTGGFTARTPLPATDYGYLAVADMNRDGRDDVVAGNHDSASGVARLDVWLNRHDQWWAGSAAITMPTWATAISISDVTGDGRLDVLTGHRNLLAVWTGDGNGGLSTSAGTYALPDFGSEIRTGDFNHDGRTDVAVAAWDAVVVFLNEGGGQLSAGTSYDAEPHPEFSDNVYRLEVADMNMDGHLDIICNNLLAILPGAGDGTFTTVQTFSPYFNDPAVVDFNGDGLPDVMNDGHVAFNTRDNHNDAPVLLPQEDITIPYRSQFGEEDFGLFPEATDPDLHRVRFEWRNGSGEIVSKSDYFLLRLLPGTHRFTLTAYDERGGSVSDEFSVTVLPEPEVVLRPWSTWMGGVGTWQLVDDATAADGLRLWDPEKGAAKTSAPLAAPDNYAWVEFVADPNQTYKLWVRGKAERNSWANDSVWLQFSGATDVSGNPIFRTGTTSGLAINLEECSGCGVSEWGWRDERWGPTLNGQPLLLRFPNGGSQSLRIQSREDGMSVDQIILSAEKYKSTPPGPAKNDTTHVPAPR